MQVEMDWSLLGGIDFEAHLREVVQGEAKQWDGDLAEISTEAMTAFEKSAIKPVNDGGYTLKSMERRINVVRAEIVQVWNSALPDDEKYRQISAKENEIAILQAGQFSFAKAGFALEV
ncbi:hypothetical protein GM415_07790 [Pseudodesulfovibrio cashew]|uniref:Uncharacterized protein n=1 Tax=Pseudodesulfovibrio cashew TaxID=2678688 RepID=A0A6I6JG36_9BACT|nr:hypothetical protein [Pseudodesulfovibrio cashew]QGY40030.1 hypothetical protein GM415_07790 [Pseudodesulfovibrio cashew]